MDRNALAELLQALESRRDAEERRREERYTALIERNRARESAGDSAEVMMRILHKYWHFQHSRVQQHRVIWMLLQPAAATSNDDTASRHLFIAICLTAGIKISTGMQECEITAYGESKEKQTSLRKKKYMITKNPVVTKRQLNSLKRKLKTADYEAGAAARSQPGPERTRAPALRAPHLHQSTQSGDVWL
ncbi:UNVERIFIED_CONTAM: hypothetical protein FKN15_001265 [Acipenser sinensis]